MPSQSPGSGSSTRNSLNFMTSFSSLQGSRPRRTTAAAARLNDVLYKHRSAMLKMTPERMAIVRKAESALEKIALALTRDGNYTEIENLLVHAINKVRQRFAYACMHLSISAVDLRWCVDFNRGSDAKLYNLNDFNSLNI